MCGDSSMAIDKAEKSRTGFATEPPGIVFWFQDW